MTRWWLGTALVAALSFSSYGGTASAAPLSNFEGALNQLAKDLADQNLPAAQRIEIIRTLSGWGTPEIREPLMAALKDPSPEVRATAAIGLGWPKNIEAAPALRAIAENPEEPLLVKAGALQALGVIGDPASRSLLVAATRHADGRVRQSALGSLTFGLLSDPSDRTTFMIQLAEDGGVQQLLRCDAIRELAQVNEERVVDGLMRIVENEPRFAMSLPEGGANAQQLMEIRRIQARDVAAWAAEALGLLKAKRAMPLLSRTAEDKSDFFLRLMSARSLILLESAEARPVFMRLLDDAVPEVRMWAVIGLEKLGDRGDLGAIKARLNDPSPFVRAQAAKTLGQLNDTSSRPLLEELQTRETDSNVQYAVDEALTRLAR